MTLRLRITRYGFFLSERTFRDFQQVVPDAGAPTLKRIPVSNAPMNSMSKLEFRPGGSFQIRPMPKFTSVVKVLRLS